MSRKTTKSEHTHQQCHPTRTTKEVTTENVVPSLGLLRTGAQKKTESSSRTKANHTQSRDMLARKMTNCKLFSKLLKYSVRNK